MSAISRLFSRIAQGAVVLGAVAVRVSGEGLRRLSRATLERAQLCRRGTLLAIVCLNLLVWLLYEIVAPVPAWQVPRVPPPKRAALTMTIKAFAPPPLERFAVIDERSVFNPLRERLATAGAAAVQQRTAPSAVLVGVILDSTQRLAITRAPGAAASVNVREGESIEGWEVAKIEPDHVELRVGNDTYQMQLFPNSSVPPVTPSPAGPAQPPMPEAQPSP